MLPRNDSKCFHFVNKNNDFTRKTWVSYEKTLIIEAKSENFGAKRPKPNPKTLKNNKINKTEPQYSKKL